MEYIPKKHKFRIVLKSVPLIVLIAALTVGGVYFGILFTLIPLIALIFAFFIQIMTEGLLSEHIYVLEGGIFRIYRKFGKSEMKIFDLDLRFAKEAAPYREIKKRKEKIKPAPRRRYCLCGAPKKDAFTVIYDPGDRRHMLFIAFDETFCRALQAEIASKSVSADDPV